jgi:hypothetical protein
MDEKRRSTLFIKGKYLEGDDSDIFETTVPPLKLGETMNSMSNNPVLMWDFLSTSVRLCVYRNCLMVYLKSLSEPRSLTK